MKAAQYRAGCIGLTAIGLIACYSLTMVASGSIELQGMPGPTELILLFMILAAIAIAVLMFRFMKSLPRPEAVSVEDELRAHIQKLVTTGIDKKQIHSIVVDELRRQ